MGGTADKTRRTAPEYGMALRLNSTKTSVADDALASSGAAWEKICFIVNPDSSRSSILLGHAVANRQQFAQIIRLSHSIGDARSSHQASSRPLWHRFRRISCSMIQRMVLRSSPPSLAGDLPQGNSVGTWSGHNAVIESSWCYHDALRIPSPGTDMQQRSSETR